MLDGWPTGGLSLNHQIRAATRMAQLGKFSEAVNRLELLSSKLPVAPQSVHVDLVLARAEIHVLMRDEANAKIEFDEAYRAAMAVESPNARAATLIKLAETHTRLNPALSR